MSHASALREAMKAKFYPFAHECGFVRGRATSLFAPFRRTRGDVVHVFDVQWDKYARPRFVINFGEGASDGVEFAGQKIPANKLEPHHCTLQGRLQRWRGGSLRTWFQLSKPWPATLRTLQWYYSPEEVVDQAIHSFAELETWWQSKLQGPHIYIWRK